ncbi:MAG: hypothetical protein Q9M19_09055, partial [Mariprofundaceae bacterium]|nr:hypothetical protein [Mariprofundaceae bacterium]
MKRIFKHIKQSMVLALFAVAAMGLSQQAMAAVSGGATIHNAVTVSYTSGATTLTATANVNVTVLTIAAEPTITAGVNQTGASGDAITYTYTVKSNANGLDTYTPGNVVIVDTGVSAPSSTAGAAAAAFSLWGGIVLSAGAGTITVPAGSTTGLIANVSTIELLVDNGAGAVLQKYTVTAVAAGTVASTVNATGATTAETNATLTLTPILAADAIIAGAGAGAVAVGVQAGEYNTFTQVVNLGAPT